MRIRDFAAKRLSRRAALLAATVLMVPSPALAHDAGEAAAASAQDAPAALDTAQAAPDDQREVIVTGSRIRGIAPVGSAVVGLDRQEIDRLPVASTTDILRQLPIVTSLGADEGTQSGGSAVQGASFNNTFARAANLRGLGTTATLVLVDGHRVAPQGVAGQISDLDIIPALAVERVEVVADGASAIYGSDAVAGVINIILRKRYTGLRAMARYGFADDYNQFQTSVGGGKAWDGGSFSLTYEYNVRSRLAAGDRPNLYTTDLSPYGGSAPSPISYPGNVLIGGVSYAIPAGQSGSNLTLANLGARGSANLLNGWTGLDAIPRQERHTAVAYFEQDVTNNLRMFAEGIYTHRSFNRRTAAVAGAATGYAVPSSNPFSPCASGKPTTNTQGIVCPANGTVNVQYSFLNDLGPSIAFGVSELWSARTGAELALGGGWRATLAGGFSRATDNSFTDNSANTAAITAAIAGTATLSSGGVTSTITRPANVPALNLFCGGVPSCNSQATLDYIRGTVRRPAMNELTHVSLGADGPLFELPGGAVRVAVGADLRWDKLVNNNIQNTVTASNQISVENPTMGERDVKSFYGELFVPIIGAGNELDWTHRLSLSMALRTEEYSDFGRTTNPKIGLTWEPVAGLNVRGSFGKSFRAPTLADINPSTAAVYRATGLTAAQANGLGLGSVSTLSFVSTTGGTIGLQPEKATTWSGGVDYRPDWLPGAYVSLNYYNVQYTNRIDQPIQNAGTLVSLQSSPLYDDFILYNPTYFPNRATLSQAAFNTAVQAIYDSTAPVFTGNTAPINTVVAITRGNKFNAGTLKTSGIDFNASYGFDSGAGAWRLGVSGTYVIRFLNQITPSASPVDLNNYFSAVGAPLRLRGRGELGWSLGGLSTNLFFNYTNRYHLTRQQIPAAAPDRYLDVRARMTVDATINYRFGPDTSLAALRGVSLQLNAQNLFDDDPPFMINNGTVPVLFDPGNASPIGRIISLQLTKEF